jgi:hypothetical protein
MKALVSIVVLLAACEDVPQPYDLDHARVMAVRIEPPAIAANESARVEVLVTDVATLEPRLATASEVELEVPAALAPFVARDDVGWVITAPDATAPIVVPLSLTVSTPDGLLPAQKTIELGRSAANPIAPAIVSSDGSDLELPVGERSFVTVEPADPALSYRWFSSIGDLVGFTRAEARVEPEAPTDGILVVVVRDQAGGTAWTIAPASAR